MGLFSNLFASSSPTQTQRSVSSSPSQEAERLYEDGLRLCQAGDPQEGMRQFVRAIDVDPKCANACAALARGFYLMDAEKYSDQVLKLGEQAYSADPTNEKACNMASVGNFEKGKIAMHRENWHEATNYFKRSNEISPGNEMTLMAFRHCADKAQLRHIFLDACEKQLKGKPDDHITRLKLGIAYAHMSFDRKYDSDEQDDYKRRAEGHLLAFLAVDPDNVDGNFNLGVVYVVSGRLDEASKIVAHLRKFDPAKSKTLEELLTD